MPMTQLSLPGESTHVGELISQSSPVGAYENLGEHQLMRIIIGEHQNQSLQGAYKRAQLDNLGKENGSLLDTPGKGIYTYTVLHLHVHNIHCM